MYIYITFFLFATSSHSPRRFPGHSEMPNCLRNDILLYVLYIPFQSSANILSSSSNLFSPRFPISLSLSLVSGNNATLRRESHYYIMRLYTQSRIIT